MPTRQENALKTRQNLLDVTHELIKEKGFYKLSIADITQRAGVAKGTFYIYFKHKEDIVREICKEYFENIKNKMNEISNDGFIEKLSLYFYNFMEAVELYGINICREWIRSVIDPKTSPESADISKWQYDIDTVKDILNNAIKNKELIQETPVELLTHLFISELYGMMTCWCMSDGAFEPKDWTCKFSQFQLKAMLEKYLVKN